MKKYNSDLKRVSKIEIFFRSIFCPFEDSFIAWEEVMNEKIPPKMFWDDLSFFHETNEDFFEWYDVYSIRHWIFLE